MNMTPSVPDTSALGSRLRRAGAEFGLWAPRADLVELTLIDSRAKQRNVDMTRREDGVWTAFVQGVKAEQRYGYRVHGTWDPSSGQRFNPAKLLLDPYARAVTGGVDYSGPILDHTAESNWLPDTTDSSASVPWSVVVADSPAPTPVAKRRPLNEHVIYETHVKGYTQLHPLVPEHLRGRYAGLAYPAVIDHLVATGITAIQLLPIHAFVSEPFVIRRGLTNYWGYNTLGFFAPHSLYSSEGSLGGQVTEFKNMVSAFHEAGIEVFLDVVYNHTGEGGHEGPTLSFRGIDHGAYYRLTNDMRNDYDVTGCGNSLDTSNPWVLEMVLDSLRYWVSEMGVDGFRFDLASTLIRDHQQHVVQDHEFKRRVAADPVLADVAMIAEPWDLGPYGYQVGAWGPGWSEWNDRYRNYIRDYWRNATPGVQELATRLSGSADLFDRPGRDLRAGVNFITAHDGFTMRDLVTYDVKHNHANGEYNRDGNDDNRSWNMGWEGESDDPVVRAARHRQVKNLMATLILSTGTPMLTAGDEIGRTQGGNNNAYCQDSPLSWVHWETLGDWSDIHALTTQLLKLRAEHPILHPQRFRYHSEVTDDRGRGLGRVDLTWMDGWDGEMGEDDWHDHGRRLLGMYVSDANEAFLTWFYAGHTPLPIRMPVQPWGSSFQIVASTAEDGELPTEPIPAGGELIVPPRTVIVMKVKVASQAVDLVPTVDATTEQTHAIESAPTAPSEASPLDEI